MSEQLRLEGEAAASRDVVEGARLRIQARKLREVAGAAERQLGLAPEPPQLPAGPGLPPNTALPAQFTTENPQLAAQAQGRPSTGTEGRPPSANGTGRTTRTLHPVRDREGRLAAGSKVVEDRG